MRVGLAHMDILSNLLQMDSVKAVNFSLLFFF